PTGDSSFSQPIQTPEESIANSALAEIHVTDTGGANIAHGQKIVLGTAGCRPGKPCGCSQCHKIRGEGSEGNGIPRLSGQSADYLYQTLEAFASGERKSRTMDPIAVFEKMAEPGSRVACAPLIYGYVPYAVAGFRPRRLAFADMPVAGGNGPVGSALGGTGIAVSAFSTDREAAIAFAYWIASGDVQRGPYAAAGGQPGHAAAWEDDAVNAATGGFYRDTRATLEGAWVRPRHDGYMAFQQQAADRINEGLAGRQDARRVVADINRLFRESFVPAAAG
ncbi:MAG: c-type cytochrome, partial [Alphaproteobacteria bacterium]|nr:c-type cytochrome [Alphaproteobacteria bacterium]